MSSDDDRPWKHLGHLGEVPYYIITFDERGECTSPAALADLRKAVKTKTDIFLFSHGWNNDWAAATARYDRFIERFGQVLQRWWRRPTRPFAPVLVGVFWPSATLVAPWEQHPKIAATTPSDIDIAALADALPPDQRGRLNRIVAEPSDDHVAELADMVAQVLSEIPDDEVGLDSVPVQPADLIAMWNEIGGQPVTSGRPGRVIGDQIEATTAPADPQAANLNPWVAIRNGIRATTVMLMKDRAGRVGGTGVAQMLHQLADASSETRLSLAGHSYGCKVILSALCRAPTGDRKVDSVLLLQPALSCYAFADKIGGKPGGYRNALNRVRLPIFTTYSRNDRELRTLFHTFLRRRSDLGEAVIAATPGAPSSKFAALGGYGPWGSGFNASWIDMPAAGVDYDYADNARIVAVDGSKFIGNHGAVETDETAWALLSQVKR
jgi:hypothetical protein